MARVFLDTNVMIATVMSDHPQHARCVDCLERFDEDALFVVSEQILAEFYSVVTRTPGYRDAPFEALSEAVEVLVGEVIPSTPLGPGDFLAAHRASVRGGAIHDWVHLQTALRSQCQHLVTLNQRHFTRFNPPQGFLIEP